jgi:hypothetical protein
MYTVFIGLWPTLRLCVCVCACMLVYVYVCVCVCVRIYRVLANPSHRVQLTGTSVLLCSKHPSCVCVYVFIGFWPTQVTGYSYQTQACYCALSTLVHLDCRGGGSEAANCSAAARRRTCRAAAAQQSKAGAPQTGKGVCSWVRCIY